MELRCSIFFYNLFANIWTKEYLKKDNWTYTSSHFLEWAIILYPLFGWYKYRCLHDWHHVNSLQRKQQDVAWLLRVTLRTVEKASLYGQLFQYIPEFYVETVTKAMYALHSYFHPIVNIEELEGKAMPLKLSNEFF